MDQKEKNLQEPTSAGDSPAAQVVASPAVNPTISESTEKDKTGNQQAMDTAAADLADLLGFSDSPAVIRRVNALRNLQVEHHKLESKFFEEVHALECQYLAKYQTIYEKRLSIIKGTYEPTEAESKCAFDEEEEEAKKKDDEKTDEQKKDEDKTVGIPDFWLQALKNSEIVGELVTEQDEPVLKHLTDVRLKLQNETDQKGFTIEFEFTPNDYFSNQTLTKSYELRMAPEEKDPLSYEGPEIVKSTGCEIQWKKGKNVTVKLVKKRQKHKSRGTVRVVTKEVKTRSFFNFFSPPAMLDDSTVEAEDDEAMDSLADDFEIGHFFRETIIPKAVLCYTGELGDEDDYDEDDEDEEDEDGDEHDDDDDDDDDDDQDDDNNERPAHHRGGARGGISKNNAGGKGRGGGGKHGHAGGGQNPECKTQ